MNTTKFKLVAAEAPGLACLNSNPCFINCPVSGGGKGDTIAFTKAIIEANPKVVYLTSDGSLGKSNAVNLMSALPYTQFRLLSEVVPPEEILQRTSILEFSFGAYPKEKWLELCQSARNAFDGVLLISLLGNTIPEWLNQFCDGVILRPIRDLAKTPEATFIPFSEKGNVGMIAAYRGMSAGILPDVLIDSFGKKVEYFGAF
jgi:hypothetical protein